MLSRSNSETNNRIRRPQSSTLIETKARNRSAVSDPTGSESNHIYALIAAHRAMDRSRLSNSHLQCQPESAIKHQFMNNNNRAWQRQPVSSAAYLRKHRSMIQATTDTSSVNASTSVPPPSLLSDGPPPYTLGSPFADFGEQYGAEPSSYRRLHRSRSTVTSRKSWQSMRTSHAQVPRNQANLLRRARSNADFSVPGLKLRLKRSFGFIHNTPKSTVSSRAAVNLPSCNPQAIAMAREQFLQGTVGILETNRGPIFGTTRAAKGKRSFNSSRRSKRSGDGDQLLDVPLTLSEKAHSISSTLRNRIKRVFSKPKPEVDTLPPQHLQAARQHFGERSSHEDTTDGFDSYCGELPDHLGRLHNHEIAPLERKNPRVSDDTAGLPASSSYYDISQTGTGSRVTSWTNSTTADSLDEQDAQRKRLSVIREDGSPHQPSSSAGIHIGGICTTRKPANMRGSNLLDGQRLYSALVKRIDEEEAITRAADSERHALPTIRSVRSQDTVQSSDSNFLQQNFIFNASKELPTPNMSPDTLRDNLERRKEQIRQLQPQSIYFSRSLDDRLDSAPSFRNAPDTHEGSQSEEAALTTRDDAIAVQQKQQQYTLSSESLYSRTTCGGPNHQYEEATRADRFSSPDIIGSEEFTNTCGVLLPRQRSSSLNRLNTDSYTRSDAATADDYKPTSCGQTEEQLLKSDPGIAESAHHLREDAQINNISGPKRLLSQSSVRSNLSARLCLKMNPSGQPPRTTTPSGDSVETLHVQRKRFPLLDVKEVTRNNTPAPRRSNSRSKSQFGVLQQVSKGNEDKQASGHDLDKGLSASLRKISPINITHLVRGKRSMPAIKTHLGFGKENRQIDFALVDEEVPKHASLQMQNSNQLGGLRKSQSQQLIPVSISPKESPADKIKASLSARLSRPFDTNASGLNRPFDNMYLGKREQGFADTTGGTLIAAHRCDVRGPHGYGGLGPSPLENPSSASDEETALPKIPTPNTAEKKAGVKTGLSVGSKRMVSNFLKSRRRIMTASSSKEDETNQEQASSQCGSPLFI